MTQVSDPGPLWPSCLLFNSQFQNAKENNKLELERIQNESDYKCVLQESNHSSKDNTNDLHLDSITLQEHLKRYREEREERINKFLKHLYTKRQHFFEEILKDKNTQRVTTVS